MAYKITGDILSASTNTYVSDSELGKKHESSQYNEYVIALRTDSIIRKLQSVVPHDMFITRDQLNFYEEIFNSMYDVFAKKFSENKFYKEYHQMIIDEYKTNYNKLKILYAKKEKPKCDEYINKLSTHIANDTNLNNIVSSLREHHVQTVYDAYKLYQDNLYKSIRDYVDTELISDDGLKSINTAVGKIFRDIDRTTNKIMQYNIDYIDRCHQKVNEFSENINSLIKTTEIYIFGDEDWDDLAQKIHDMFQQYISLDIPYNGVDPTPAKLREMYETDIKISHRTLWLNEIGNIKLQKYREGVCTYVNEQVEYYSLDTRVAVPSDISELVCMDGTSYCECNDKNIFTSPLISKEIIITLGLLVRECKMDLYWTGLIFNAYRDTDQWHIYTDTAYRVLVARMGLVTPGIYTKETIPAILIENDIIKQKLFTRIPVDNHAIYMLTPFDMEMFGKLVDYYVCMRDMDVVKNYYGLK